MIPRERFNSADELQLQSSIKKKKFDFDRSHSASKAFDTSSSEEEKKKLYPDELNKISAKEENGSSEKDLEFRE